METTGIRNRRLGRCLTLGATAAISLCHLTYCSIGCEDGVIQGAVRNESSGHIVIVSQDEWFYSQSGYRSRNIKLNAGESETGSSAYDLLGGQRCVRMTFSIATTDSVIEVETVDPALCDIDENPFELLNTPTGIFNYQLILTDTYLAELADTMRKMGHPPYAIAHEFVVNGTGQDFTLRCVAPEGTREYAIAAGDSAEVERRWLMEWAGVEGGHYEFVFEDSTQTVWPADARVYSLATAREGDDPGPRRYFDCTVSRDGGGTRRYEITDKLLQEIAGEMTILRFTQPGLFGR